MTSRWLNDNEDRAWRGYRRLFTMLEARLARDLADDTGLSTADYTVLSNLAEAEGRRRRLTALADHMEWSQSRLSHQIARMESRGLVERRHVEADGRGTMVVLARRGLKTIAAATPVHMKSVRAHMVDLLTDDQLRTMGDIADTVVGHLAEREPDADVGGDTTRG